MRHFNEVEKQVIRNIVKSPVLAEEGMVRTSVLLEENYIGPKHELSMLINADEKMVIISGPESKKEFVEKIVLVVTIFNLLRDLRKEGMLSIVGDSKDISGALGRQFQNGQNVKLTNDIAITIIEYFDNFIIVSEELRQLVKNNFRSAEQIRHRETLFVAIGALIVSITLGLWCVIKDVCN